ncbi:MAG: hypothetical protein IPM97_12530 [Bdellovibrionaceae bacterium]|nr:hypothetical protein [Pseudobdellovibrionaceae bacterium]
MTSGQAQPTRRGYCLGLRVIREVANVNALGDMIKWEETKFSVEIEKTLNEIVNK